MEKIEIKFVWSTLQDIAFLYENLPQKHEISKKKHVEAYASTRGTPFYFSISFSL